MAVIIVWPLRGRAGITIVIKYPMSIKSPLIPLLPKGDTHPTGFYLFDKHNAGAQGIAFLHLHIFIFSVEAPMAEGTPSFLNCSCSASTERGIGVWIGSYHCLAPTGPRGEYYCHKIHDPNQIPLDPPFAKGGHPPHRWFRRPFGGSTPFDLLRAGAHPSQGWCSANGLTIHRKSNW